MRGVLEEKFAIDGVVIDQLILKDNLRNIRKGRFKAVTNQIGYKLPALFQQRRGLGKTVTETLFGDDTEADALIYALYADALAQRIDTGQIARVMTAMETPSQTIDTTLRALNEAGPGDVVERVFIRIHRGLPIRCYRKLGPNIIPVFSWFQATLVLFMSERLNAKGVSDTMRACLTSDDMNPTQLGFLVQDAIRRDLIEPNEFLTRIHKIEELAELFELVEKGLADLGNVKSGIPRQKRDYLGFVKDIQRKH